MAISIRRSSESFTSSAWVTSLAGLLLVPHVVVPPPLSFLLCPSLSFLRPPAPATVPAFAPAPAPANAPAPAPAPDPAPDPVPGSVPDSMWCGASV